MAERKFYKIEGLSSIFTVETINDNGVNKEVYNTSVSGIRADVEEVIAEYINKQTLMFIIANDTDAGRYIQSSYVNSDSVEGFETRLLQEGDTVIWARGKAYCVSGHSVRSVVFDTDENAIKIIYTDGTETLMPSTQSGYSAGTNIYISDEREISAIGYLFDENGNFIQNSNNNTVEENITNASVDGYGNTANANNQKVSGAYNTPDSNQAYILGGGTDANNPKNIFTVDFNGKGFYADDVTAGGSYDSPTNKLSDIHSVIDDDWVEIQ